MWDEWRSGRWDHWQLSRVAVLARDLLCDLDKLLAFSRVQMLIMLSVAY